MMTMDTPTNSEALPLTPCPASSIREKAETERWFFIAEWCKKQGISPMLSQNYDRAAMEWAKKNCFPPNVPTIASDAEKTTPKETTL
jgi:hypothetical protein